MNKFFTTPQKQPGVIRRLAVEMLEKIAPPDKRGTFLGPRFEPSNISTNATVTSVQNAIREAENGEPTELFRFYRDSLLSDDHIQGCINTRKLATLCQPLAVMAKDKNNPEDKALANGFKRAIEDCENWEDGLGSFLDSSFWPVSITEKLFMPAGEPAKDEPKLQFTLRRFEPVNYMLLCYRWAYLTGGVGLGTSSPVQNAAITGAKYSPDQSGNPYLIDLEQWEPFIKLWPIDAAGRIIYDASRAAYLDKARHLVHRGHLLTAHKDNWGGPGRACLFWWLLRGLGRDWFARFMERYGNPFPVGKTNVEDPQAVALLQTAFSLATKIGGLVISQEDSVELVQAMVQGGAEGHQTWHNVCNNAISRHLTGYKDSDKPAGLNAGEDNMVQSVREDVRMFDQLKLGATLKRQLIEPFANFNGLRGKVQLSWGGLSEDDAQSFALTVKTLSDSGLELTDESIPVANERLGFSVQRKAVPDPTAGFSAPSAFSAVHSLHVAHPSDAIAQKRRQVVGQAYRGVMAPFREIILSSSSPEDCLQKLTAFYPDWKPERLKSEMETALQLCAAAGAADGQPN